MTEEIELINDGDGIAVFGAARDVDAFLSSRGFDAVELEVARLRPSYNAAAGILGAASFAVAESGKWLQLTDESAKALKNFSMVQNSVTGNFHATLSGADGFVKNLQFVGGSAAATNPAMLAAYAALMSQMATRQAIQEVGDYLEVIDEKIDDILRAQKDAVLADMVGVDLVIEEAMTIRDEVGHVSDVTWSKVQATALTIASTQAYALRRIDALADKVESAGIGELAAAAKEAEPKVREWLLVLAHCVKLQDSLAVLELDRVLDGSPDDLPKHHLGVRTAREKRLEMIHRSTEELLERMNLLNGKANAKVLTSPIAARKAVASSDRVVVDVLEFQTALGIEDGHESTSAKRWRTAVGEVRDKVVETGADGVDRLRSGAGRLSYGVRACRDAVREGDSDSTAD